MAVQTPGIQGAAHADCFGPARVLEVDEAGRRVQVMMAAEDESADDATGPRSAWADWALPQACELGWGDTVLVAGRTLDDLYVIGLLASGAATEEPPAGERQREISLESGARAAVAGEGDGQRLEVYSDRGELIFEYDPEAGRGRVDLQGDLEFVSRNGRIDFIAARGVRFFSRESIEMLSVEGVKLAAADVIGKTFSALEVGKRRLDVRSDELRVASGKAGVEIDRVKFSGRSLTTSVELLRTLADRTETVVGTAIEKAKNVYREVEGLSQLRAGRLRNLVEGLYQLKSRNAFLEAEKDMKIDGDSINLG